MWDEIRLTWDPEPGEERHYDRFHPVLEPDRID